MTKPQRDASWLVREWSKAWERTHAKLRRTCGDHYEIREGKIALVIVRRCLVRGLSVPTLGDLN